MESRTRALWVRPTRFGRRKTPWPLLALLSLPLLAGCDGRSGARIESPVVFHERIDRPLLTAPTEAGSSLHFDNPSFLPRRMDLPVLWLATEGGAPVESKDEYLPGWMYLDGAFHELGVRGRGNSTWAMPKKPFRIKLDKRASLLGMPADRDWALLANYADKTMLRNELAFEISRRTGLAWTPRSRFVELFLNASYLGVYQLTETVKIASQRVDIHKLEASSTDITGGYLLEICLRREEEFWFDTRRGVPINIKRPKAITPAQFAYIRDQVQELEDVLFSPGFADPLEGYARHVDVDSLVDWYVVNELLKNNDGIFYSSVFLHKPRGKRLVMGPVWDFDLAAGNVNYNGNDEPTGWWVKHALWYERLFEDPVFASRVAQRFRTFSEDAQGLLDYLDSTAAYLAIGQGNNFRRWLILDKWVWPNAVVTGSFQGEIDYLKDWLGRRIRWIDEVAGGY